jgi:hypothetical protein
MSSMSTNVDINNGALPLEGADGQGMAAYGGEGRIED